MDTSGGASGRSLDRVSAVLDADFVHFPYFHQLREFEDHCETDARALFWQMRTGKTKACVDLACHNRVNRGLDAVIVLAPNGVHANWVERELPKHHWPHVRYSGLAWNTEVAGRLVHNAHMGHRQFWDRAEQMLASDELTWFSFASETVTRDDVRKLVARVMRRKRRVLLIVDESDDYGKPGSKKTKMVRALSKRCFMRRILSGTPIENSPLRAFSQYEILKEEALGFRLYSDFESRYAEYEMKRTRQGRSYPALKDYRNLDELTKRMSAYSSVVLRGDCEDLPDLIPLRREVEMTEQQRSVYRQLYDTYRLQMESGELVSIGERAARLVKFQQVASGFVRDEFGVDHWIEGGNPRLDGLVHEVLTSPGKTIVWCVFRSDLDAVAAALRAHGRKVLEYHGRTSEADKALARTAFAPESDSDFTDLVGHPKSGGRGLDLSGASKIIHYSHTFDAVVRTQADERATQMGGENIPIVDFRCAPIDDYAMDTVKRKIDIADRVSRDGIKRVLRSLEL